MTPLLLAVIKVMLCCLCDHVELVVHLFARRLRLGACGRSGPGRPPSRARAPAAAPGTGAAGRRIPRRRPRSEAAGPPPFSASACAARPRRCTGHSRIRAAARPWSLGRPPRGCLETTEADLVQGRNAEEGACKAIRQVTHCFPPGRTPASSSSAGGLRRVFAGRQRSQPCARGSLRARRAVLKLKHMSPAKDAICSGYYHSHEPSCKGYVGRTCRGASPESVSSPCAPATSSVSSSADRRRSA